jgi:hypothetical protein
MITINTAKIPETEYSSEILHTRKYQLKTPKCWLFMTLDEVYQDIENKHAQFLKMEKNAEIRNIKNFPRQFR